MFNSKKTQMKDAHHASSGDGMVHHHILPYSTYFIVFGVLLFLTVITVLVSYAGFPQPWAIIIAMIVAMVKAALVAAIFMHLKWDNPYNRLIFVGSLLFLSLFFYFTFADLTWRGKIVEEGWQYIAPEISIKKTEQTAPQH